MAKYFYTDADGKQQGPITEQQIENLVAQGTITPTTPMRMEIFLGAPTVGDAWHILPRRMFPGQQYRGASTPWQFNFETHLGICRTCCIIVWIAAIFGGLAAIYWGFQTFNSEYAPAGAKFFAFIGVVVTWGYCAFCVAVTHMLCTWSLITSKAAQLYVESCEKK